VRGVGFVYYSRTGCTRRLVEKLVLEVRSRGVGVGVHEVRMVKEYSPPLHLNPRLFIDTVAGRRVEIVVEPEYRGFDYVLTVLATPIWFGRPAPAIRQFAEEHRGRGIDVVCIATSAIGRGYVEALRRVLEEYGYRVHACLDAKEDRLEDLHVNTVLRVYRELLESSKAKT